MLRPASTQPATTLPASTQPATTLPASTRPATTLLPLENRRPDGRGRNPCGMTATQAAICFYVGGFKGSAQCLGGLTRIR
jgi:hypothetical protein